MGLWWGSLFKATHRYCPPVSNRYISLTDSVRLLPLEGLQGEGVRGLSLLPPSLCPPLPQLYL